jgi:hypothetical protein
LRVLVVAPEDTVSGSKRPGMLMIEVALRKQLQATGANSDATTKPRNPFPGLSSWEVEAESVK